MNSSGRSNDSETSAARPLLWTAFLAQVSHEVRTPLSAILGMTELLREDEKDTYRREMLDVILEASRSLSKIVNDLLDLSRIESGRIAIRTEPVSPRAIVEQVVALMRVRAADAGVTLATEFHGRLPETITTDGGRLSQIILNLVTNAINYSPRGTVVVALAYEGDSARSIMHFRVIDTGPGIPEDERERVFDPFVRLGPVGEGAAGGSGLGLAICRRLAHLLGGTLTLTSAVGTGSTFLLSLDTGDVGGAAAVDSTAGSMLESGDEPNSSSLRGHRVLVVEDVRANQFLIRTILERAGAEVQVVGDGVRALAEMQNAPRGVDIILMDITMPLLDGYEATRRLRVNGCGIPIVALTAGAMRGDRERCLAAGCNDYVAKPIDRRELIETLVRLLG